MPHKITYLALEEVLAIHDNQIETHGGSHGIRDLGLLESALARPQSSFAGEDLYPDIFHKAAVFMQSIILNHSFLDGNKRTGTVSAARFLFLNGYNIKVTNKILVDLALKVAAKKITLEQLAKWLKKHTSIGA